MKILITGAAGFVGCRATRFLGLSHQVIPLNSKQLDVTDEEMIHTLFMDHAPKPSFTWQPFPIPPIAKRIPTIAKP